MNATLKKKITNEKLGGTGESFEIGRKFGEGEGEHVGEIRGVELLLFPRDVLRRFALTTALSVDIPSSRELSSFRASLKRFMKASGNKLPDKHLIFWQRIFFNGSK